MARRRMFSLDIIDTDLFTTMPQSTRLLYYELCMRADDDGFIGSPKKIMKNAGCSEDDFKVLITKKFIIPFESGIIVIKHWRLHNYIQKDRYKPTIYITEKMMLEQATNGEYIAKNDACIQNVYKMDTQVRLGKVSIAEDNITSISEDIIGERDGNGNENQINGERDGNREENLFEFVEKIFARPLSATEYEIINTWEDNEITRYAIKQADLARAYKISYIERILLAYKHDGIDTLEKAKERDKRFKERKNKSNKLTKTDFTIGKVYEVDGVKFKINADGKKEIL